MKKLMTMMTVAATAFGLYAADWPTGTGFDSATVTGALADNPTLGEIEVPASGNYWTIPESGNPVLTIKAYGSETQPSLRSTYATTTWFDNFNYLSIKTAFGNPLTRKLNTAGTAKLIDTGIYFDAQVKFTACDEAPTTIPADAKMAVYVIEDEQTGKQYLKVKAGYIGESGAMSWKTYDCGEWSYGDAWVRLTVKTIGNILAEGGNCPGFIVFINSDNGVGSMPYGSSDTKMVSAYSAKLTDNALAFGTALFPAYVSNIADDNNTLTSISFDGQGALDDLVINNAAPFDSAKDKAFFTVTPDANISSYKWAVGSDTAVAATGVAKIPYVENMVVTISDIEPAEGYMFKDITSADAKATVDGKVITVVAEGATASINSTAVKATVVIGGVATQYPSIADAIAAINKLGVTAQVGLTLADDTGAIKIDNSDIGAVVIDLAGKNVTGTSEDAFAIESGDSALTITNSTVAVGVVDGLACTDAGCAAGATVTIQEGIFKGVFVGGDLIVDGGKFDREHEDATLPTNYVWVEPAPGGYWTIAEKKSEPVVPGDEPAIVEAETAEEAVAKVEIALTEEVAEVVGEGAEAYKALFKKTATEALVPGTWSVSVDFDTTKAAVQAIQEAVDTATESIDLATVAASGGSVSIANSVAGVYYVMESANDLGDIEPTECKLGDGKALTLTAPKYTGKGFYRVKVSAAKVEIPTK